MYGGPEGSKQNNISGKVREPEVHSDSSMSFPVLLCNNRPQYLLFQACFQGLTENLKFDS